MIKPARRKNLYEEISKQIIEMIDNGYWKPGQKIPGEIELSKSFEVSRNSIRESIKALELVGILTSKTGRGTFVSEHANININNMNLSSIIENESSIIELMETRLIVEPGLVYLAVVNATQDDVKILEDTIEKAKVALKDKNYSFELGFEFHRHLIKMSNNKILINLMDSITENLISARKKIFFKHLSEYILNNELDEHAEILNLIKNKDAEGAKDAMYNHIAKSLSLLKKRIESIKKN